MTGISTITAAITILITVAGSAGTTAAPAGISPALVKSGLQVPGPHEVTFRRRYYREYAPYSYYAPPPAVTYYAPPVYGYAAPPPAYYAPPSVYYPPIRRYYGPPVVYIDPDDDYAPRRFLPYYTGW
jgi:hypothetical protein